MKKNNKIGIEKVGWGEVVPHTSAAPGRFELPSRDPESRMLDHYTTGLFPPPG